jgi:hypothetical protein
VRGQSTPGLGGEVSRNSNCEAPVGRDHVRRSAFGDGRAQRRRGLPGGGRRHAAFVSWTRMSIVTAPLRPARADQELQPFLCHEPVIGLRHVDPIQAHEAIALGGGREERGHLDDRDPAAPLDLVLLPRRTGSAESGSVHVVERKTFAPQR